jgi:hypothetical protein
MEVTVCGIPRLPWLPGEPPATQAVLSLAPTAKAECKILVNIPELLCCALLLSLLLLKLNLPCSFGFSALLYFYPILFNHDIGYYFSLYL